jgi:hypothetical protein
MVHALETTRSLLRNGGLLIDLHPSGQPPQVEVYVHGKMILAGHVQETDDFVEYFQADDALADVTARGLFELERMELFPFLLHAPTVTAMADHIEAEWSDAVLTEKVIERTTALMGEPGEGKEIVIRELIRISRYRASGR